jgi:hypothetical protein
MSKERSLRIVMVIHKPIGADVDAARPACAVVCKMLQQTPQFAHRLHKNWYSKVRKRTYLALQQPV